MPTRRPIGRVVSTAAPALTLVISTGAQRSGEIWPRPCRASRSRSDSSAALGMTESGRVAPPVRRRIPRLRLLRARSGGAVRSVPVRAYLKRLTASLQTGMTLTASHLQNLPTNTKCTPQGLVCGKISWRVQMRPCGADPVTPAQAGVQTPMEAIRLPAPDRVEGRLCAGMTTIVAVQSG